MTPENQGGQNPYGQMPQPQYQQAPQYPSPTSPQPQNNAVFQAPPTPKRHNWLTIGVIVVLVILFIVAGSLAIWSYMHYRDASHDVQSQIDKAVATAKRDQANTDETKFLEREKQPNRQFVGPDNYGRVTFDYPKTWSAYVDSDTDTNGGTYKAYLNPGVVPPTGGSESLFALRVTIQQIDYSKALKQYQALVKTGKLKSSSFSVNGHNGTRFDGNFTKELRGSAVLFQIRDKVLIIQTDANTFLPDFNKIVKTINFNS